MNDKNGIALAYGVNMLRLLLSMRLISESEYRSILQLQAEHYDPQKSYVFSFNSRYSRWMYANSCGILRVAAEKAVIQKRKISAERRTAWEKQLPS